MSPVMDALNKLCKWRTVLAGWQLGTRAKGDAECDAVRDHREITMLLRAEVNALTRMCIDKKLFSQAEYNEQMTIEAEHLDKSYEKMFPGFTTTTLEGVAMDVAKCRETMKGWRP